MLEKNIVKYYDNHNVLKILQKCWFGTKFRRILLCVGGGGIKIHLGYYSIIHMLQMVKIFESLYKTNEACYVLWKIKREHDYGYFTFRKITLFADLDPERP